MGVCPLEKIVTSDCIAKTIVQLSIIKNGICFVSLHAFPLVVKMEFVRDICVRFGCHSGETRKHIYISKCPLVLRKSSAQLESRINIAHTKWTDGVIPKCSMRQHRSLLSKSELQVTRKHCQRLLRVSLPFLLFFLMVRHAVYVIER